MDSSLLPSDSGQTDERSWKWWYADFPTLSLYDFQMCFSLCMCASLPSRWVQSSVVLELEICAVQTLLDSSPIHTNISQFLFFLQDSTPLLFEAWLMQSPLKCWYKIKLPCTTVIKSLGTGINTWSSLFSMAFLHVISSFPKPFLGREEKASLADLATYPSLTSFPCRRLTMTVWLVAACHCLKFKPLKIQTLTLSWSDS